VGERWRFVASMFSTHDTELLLAVTFDGSEEYRILLNWTPAGNQVVIESFSEFVALDSHPAFGPLIIRRFLRLFGTP
jgi:hypothetical protein